MSFLVGLESSAGGHIENLIVTLRAIARASPDLPSIWVQLAESLEDSGAVSEAVEAWRTAYRLVPNSQRISSALRRLEAGAGAPDVAPARAMARETDLEPKGAEAPSQSQIEVPLDIDRLISDLQSGRGRISIDHRKIEFDPIEQADDEEIATETLARIYEAQSLFIDAVKIYDLLAEREENLAKAEILRTRAEDLRKRISQPG